MNIYEVKYTDRFQKDQSIMIAHETLEQAKEVAEKAMCHVNIYAVALIHRAN